MTTIQQAERIDPLGVDKVLIHGHGYDGFKVATINVGTAAFNAFSMDEGRVFSDLCVASVTGLEIAKGHSEGVLRLLVRTDSGENVSIVLLSKGIQSIPVSIG